MNCLSYPKYIRAMIFDLDNTLYDENLYLRAVCERFCQIHNLDARIDSILSPEFRACSKDIFGDWLKSFDFYTPQRQEELFFLYESLQKHDIHPTLRFYDDARELLKDAKAKGFKLGILTNGGLKAQAHKISLLEDEILEYGFVIEYARSQGKAYEKPHKSAFMRILNALKVSAQESVFIGDNPLTDIVGAHHAEIFSIRLNRGYGKLIHAPIKAQMEVDNLTQIRSIWS